METFIELDKILKDIVNKGYIKLEYLDSGGAGKMLEKLLGKKLDNKSIPDYKDVEIKVSNKKTKYPISLLSIIPKNKMKVNTIKYLIKNYSHNGCADDNKNNRYLNGNINTQEIKYVNKKTGFKLEIDKNNNKLYLLIIQNKKIIDNNIYWDLNEVEERINQKMKYLIIVTTKTKKINNVTHCIYKDIMYYKLKSFYFFKEALESGVINVSFSIKIDVDDKITYHGIRFCINIKDITNIYTKVHIKTK